MVSVGSRCRDRALIFTLALTVWLLPGCFWSNAPLVSARNAAFPIQDNVIVRELDLSGPGEVKIKESYSVSLEDDYYVFTSGGKVKFSVRLAQIGNTSQYIAMLRLPGEPRYAYGLAEQRSDGFHFFSFTASDFDTFKRTHLVTAPLQSVKGDVAVQSLASLIDLFPRMAAAGAFASKSVYRIVDSNSVTSSVPVDSGAGEPRQRGAWQLIETTNPLTDAAVPVARLNANRVDGAAQGVLLQLECQGREAVVFLDWAGVPLRTLFKPGGAAITDIDVRFDDARPNRLVWSIVSDGDVRNPPPGAGAVIQMGLNIDATLIPSRRGLNATWLYDDFARPLSSSRRLIVQAHSSKNQTMTAFFDTVGAAAAVNHLRRVCP
jgi:hypothetical protein